MPSRIEDYALLSDCRTAALVSSHGSVDWFCPPRFHSASTFGALLGGPEQGQWSLRPAHGRARPKRAYAEDSFLLVTTWATPDGVAEVTDLLPVDGDQTHLVRRIRGVSGSVTMRTELRIRFDYARTLPWLRQAGRDGVPELRAIGGPDAVVVRGVALEAHGRAHVAEFTVAAGETRDLVLTWYPSHLQAPPPVDVDALVASAQAWWRRWAGDLHTTGPYAREAARSLLVLRALSDRDTGGIVAAPTTSLPEQFGGSRNWDYRYVWLRDAALTLATMIRHRHLEIAAHWRSWLLRAVAGDAAEVQVLYGISGERELFERELDSLPGYEGSAPVRVGNGAVDQFQADVAGEVISALFDARRAGVFDAAASWALQRALIRHVATTVDRADNGIWEIRGEPRQFTHSKVMVWTALDRGVRAVREEGLPGDDGHWAHLRDRVRAEIDAHGVDPATGAFRQHFDGDEVDASLLVIPQTGFCEPGDPRMIATVQRIERELMPDGLVLRYRTASGVDGLSGSDNPFLACTFWLVEQYARTGRRADAVRLMDRACGLANDLGLLSEEYDVAAARQAGNFPQALSHLALVRAADALA